MSATDTTVDYKAPGIGQARFGWQGPLRIDGKNIPLSGYARFDNPYTTTAYGQGRYVIRGAGHRLVIDFKTGEYRDEAPRAQLSTEVK